MLHELKTRQWADAYTRKLVIEIYTWKTSVGLWRDLLHSSPKSDIPTCLKSLIVLMQWQDPSGVVTASSHRHRASRGEDLRLGGFEFGAR